MNASPEHFYRLDQQPQTKPSNLSSVRSQKPGFSQPTIGGKQNIGRGVFGCAVTCVKTIRAPKMHRKPCYCHLVHLSVSIHIFSFDLFDVYKGLCLWFSALCFAFTRLGTSTSRTLVCALLRLHRPSYEASLVRRFAQGYQPRFVKTNVQDCFRRVSCCQTGGRQRWLKQSGLICRLSETKV